MYPLRKQTMCTNTRILILLVNRWTSLYEWLIAVIFVKSRMPLMHPFNAHFLIFLTECLIGISDNIRHVNSAFIHGHLTRKTCSIFKLTAHTENHDTALICRSCFELLQFPGHKFCIWWIQLLISLQRNNPIVWWNPKKILSAQKNNSSM